MPHAQFPDADFKLTHYLLPEGERPQEGNWIVVGVTRVLSNGKMLGVITRSNRRGARGEPGYERGAFVVFEERHVWHVAP